MKLSWYLDSYHYDRTTCRLASWWSVGYSVLAPSDIVALTLPPVTP